MGHPQIAAFARSANGATEPRRSIAGQNTLITRTIHDMAYDPIHDEIVVPQFMTFAILTFAGNADGNDCHMPASCGQLCIVADAPQVVGITHRHDNRAQSP